VSPPPHTHTHTQTQTNKHTNKHKHTNTQTNTHTHTHTHTHHQVLRCTKPPCNYTVDGNGARFVFTPNTTTPMHANNSNAPPPPPPPPPRGDPTFAAILVCASDGFTLTLRGFQPSGGNSGVLVVRKGGACSVTEQPTATSVGEHNHHCRVRILVATCTCIHTHTHTHTHSHTHTHTHSRKPTRKRTHTHTRTYTRTHAHTHTPEHVLAASGALSTASSGFALRVDALWVSEGWQNSDGLSLKGLGSTDTVHVCVLIHVPFCGRRLHPYAFPWTSMPPSTLDTRTHAHTRTQAHTRTHTHASTHTYTH
jgi:hypothetical protein